MGRIDLPRSCREELIELILRLQGPRTTSCPGSATRLGLRPTRPVVLALNDTIERRWGLRIQARGIYRYLERSSGAHFIETTGLRWMSLMLLTPIPWARRIWALPFLTALVSSPGSPPAAARPSASRRSQQCTASRRCCIITGATSGSSIRSETPTTSVGRAVRKSQLQHEERPGR